MFEQFSNAGYSEVDMLRSLPVISKSAHCPEFPDFVILFPVLFTLIPTGGMLRTY